MIDDTGLMFTASVRTAEGVEVHRETSSRAELLEWLRVHGGTPSIKYALVTRVGIEASGPAAIAAMIVSLEFGQSQLERPHYTCPRCGRTSYNPHDVREQYCGACHQFEDLR